MKTHLLVALLVMRAGWACGAPPSGTHSIQDAAVRSKQFTPQNALVTSVHDGWVEFTAGRTLWVGERFYVHHVRWVSEIDSITHQTEWVAETTRGRMLVVDQADGQRGAARLPRNADAAVSDLLIPTTDPYRGSLAYGRRFPSLWRVHSELALVGIGLVDRGVAHLGRAAVEYRFRAPLKLAVELGPVLFATGLTLNSADGSGRLFQGTTGAGSLRAVVGLALSGLELSAGLGAAWDVGLATPGALQLGVAIRLGSLDGLNLSADATLFPPSLSRRNVLDSASGALNVPVHRLVTLVLAASGGLPLWGWGGIGTRVYARGAGGPGTTIVSAMLGALGLTARIECPPPTTANITCVAGSSAVGFGLGFQLGIDRRF